MAKTITKVIRVDNETKKLMNNFYEPMKREKTPPYAIFQADTGDTIVTLYESGKAMFQGVSADIESSMWENIKNNKEGFYIKFIVDINNMNVETFENWIRKNDNVLKFITIKMEHSLEQKTNIYNEIKRLGESNLFNAIAEEVIYQLDNNSTDTLELTVENVKDIVNDILDDDYFNDNLNNCVKYAIESKVKEQEEIEEQEEV